MVEYKYRQNKIIFLLLIHKKREEKRQTAVKSKCQLGLFIEVYAFGVELLLTLGDTAAAAGAKLV